MVRGAKLRIHGTVFAAGRETKGDMAKGCLEVVKRRKEKAERGTRRRRSKVAIYASEPRSRVPARVPRSARWIRLLGGVVERREGFREEERAHERVKEHPRGPPACSV